MKKLHNNQSLFHLDNYYSEDLSSHLWKAASYTWLDGALLPAIGIQFLF